MHAALRALWLAQRGQRMSEAHAYASGRCGVAMGAPALWWLAEAAAQGHAAHVSGSAPQALLGPTSLGCMRGLCTSREAQTNPPVRCFSSLQRLFGTSPKAP